MNNCKDIREKLSAFVDDELPPEEHGLIEKHLHRCTSCADDERSLRKIIELLDVIPDESPAPALTSKIMRRAAWWKCWAYVKEQIVLPVATFVSSRGCYPAYRYLRNFDDFPPESLSSIYISFIQGVHK